MSALVNAAGSDVIMVPLDRIQAPEAPQTRAKISPAAIRDYAAVMAAQLAEGGVRFPPIVVFSNGQDYWLGDGFHRLLAARKAGLSQIAAEVRQGTQRDAVLFGISANNVNGMPRTRADRRKGVGLLLADSEWSQWSNREIARRCQVTHVLVNRMRRAGACGTKFQIARKVQRGGTVYEMNLASRGTSDETTNAAAPASTAATAPVTDALGIPLPETRAAAFAGLADFREARALLDQLAQLVNRIAKAPCGEAYRQELIRTTIDGATGFACAALRACQAKLMAAEPHCAYCPNCLPTHASRPHPSCKTCGGRGWTTLPAFERCRQSDRQQILNLRAATLHRMCPTQRPTGIGARSC